MNKKTAWSRFQDEEQDAVDPSTPIAYTPHTGITYSTSEHFQVSSIGWVLKNLRCTGLRGSILKHTPVRVASRVSAVPSVVS